jgi:ubiquinone/menaquinone biosynthesis C-methylase UbiE
MPDGLFAGRAREYDRLRPLDESWWAIFERLVEEADLRGQRVLDVGCGTGRLSAALVERAGARVWGLEPAPQMLAVARERLPSGAGLKQGRAEELPFRDGWFDRVVFWLVAHHVDRPAAFAEAARVLVPAGKIALVTFDPDEFPEHWLVRYFPSMETIDRGRFPSVAQLEAELPAAGFAPPRFVRVEQRRTIPRADALERIRGRHVSTFDLIDSAEYEAGLARAERELPEEVDVHREGLIVVAGRRSD